MAKQNRQYCESGYYHITSRGVGKMIIFEDDKDYTYFLNLLSKYSKKYKIGIAAHCIMSNHFHLIVKDPHTKISKFMMCVKTCYAMHYNKKYIRFGHLFQGRFDSRCINDEYYLLRACKYVLRNPEEANICGACNYRWSSLGEHQLLNSKKNHKNHKTVTDFSLLYKIIGCEANLYKFVESKNDKSFIANIENKNYINNIDTANNLAKKLIDSSSCSIVQTFGINSRDETIFKFFSNRISPKHIAKITGLGLGIVYRAIRKMNKCGYKIIHFNFDDYPRRGKVLHLKGTNPRAGILCT